ncbi:MAG: hypothetical protein ACI9F9_002997 [Candidatus Paceibacteria bacterium]|jgi:hypothetical protein
MKDTLRVILLFALGACSTAVTTDADGARVADLNAPVSLPTGVHDVLAGASEMKLFAIHPFLHPPAKEDRVDAALFHFYTILGQASLSEESMRCELVDTLYKGIEASRGDVAMCFSPRHGLRAEHKGHQVDFVICYECLSMEIHLDGVRHRVLTGQAAGAALTKIYEGAGLSIHSGKDTGSEDR